MILSVSFLVKKWPMSFSRDVNCFHPNLATVIDRVSHNLLRVKIRIFNLHCHSGVLLQYYMSINLILDSFLRLSDIHKWVWYQSCQINDSGPRFWPRKACYTCYVLGTLRWRPCLAYCVRSHVVWTCLRLQFCNVVCLAYWSTFICKNSVVLIRNIIIWIIQQCL